MSHLDGIILDIDEGERGRYRVTSDGRQQFQPQITISEDGFEMLKQGYLCGRCFEDLRPVGAFPETCPCCNFRVRDLQAQQIEQDYQAHVMLGSRLSLSDELARLGEMWIPEQGAGLP
jgi:hypothetical protein